VEMLLIFRCLVFIAGFAASFWLPEPPTRELDHEGPGR
jgi:hypothetical protein